jgi:hypothetical protein
LVPVVQVPPDVQRDDSSRSIAAGVPMRLIDADRQSLDEGREREIVATSRGTFSERG